MTEKENELLRISYSNNKLLFELSKKKIENSEKISDLSFILNFRDSSNVWTVTTINMILFSGILSTLSYFTTNLDKQDCKTLFAGLTLGSIVYGYKRCEIEKEEQEKCKNLILEKYDITEISDYTKMQLEDLLKEQKAIKNMINEITIREEAIKDELNGKVKKLSK